MARPLALLGLHRQIENLVGAAVRGGSRQPTAGAFIRAERPSAFLALCPFLPVQMGVAAEARRQRIPVIAFITSWDNITTKSRMASVYDGYCVWSEEMRRQLHQFYPHTRDLPVHVVGAPQYEAMNEPRFLLDRQTFCLRHGLDPLRKLIVYCLGSPNLIREEHGALEFARRMRRHPSLMRCQLIIRPHPGFSEAQSDALRAIRSDFADVVVQSPNRHWDTSPIQGEASVIEWVNTIRHADVVVNLASTITVDAAVLDRPVVNIDFDPEPGGPNNQLVREINHTWNHFGPLTASRGAATVSDYDSMLDAIATYINHPEKDREGRAWIVGHVCGTDLRPPGLRLARAVIEIMEARNAPSSS